MHVCTLLQTDNHASTHHSVFTGQMPFLPHNQQRQCTEGWVWRGVDAFVFSTEPVGVVTAASVPEDAELVMLSVVEPVLLQYSPSSHTHSASTTTQQPALYRSTTVLSCHLG